MSMFKLAISCVWPCPTYLIHGPNIAGCYATLFFTASDFTSITRHTHTWALLPLWPSHCSLTGAISKCPLLFPSSMLDTFQPGGLLFWCCIFLPFHTVMGFSRQEYWSGLPFPSPVDHVLLELFTMTCPPWVALNGMAHTFTVLCKPLCHNKALIHEEEKPRWKYILYSLHVWSSLSLSLVSARPHRLSWPQHVF